MPGEADHLRVLAYYGDRGIPEAIESLGSAGGFSGARFWRIITSSQILCLRRWPKEHPSIEGLEFIQAVLWYVAREGFELVPLPLENVHRGGYVRWGGYLWELAPWMPGKADYWRGANDRKLRAAMSALAGFHLACSTFPLPQKSPANSPGIAIRLARLGDWLRGDLAELATAVEPRVWPEMASRGRRILELVPVAAQGVFDLLARAARREVAMQPCIRDVWHDHILYEGDRVSGLIDFGSMQPDNVAADVARLLGSLAGDDPRLWELGLKTYEVCRPLSTAELELVRAFDRSTVLMAGLNWLDWVFRQRRRFERRRAVVERVDAILNRLELLARQ